MANWIRGSFTVTGKKENVERFLEEGLKNTETRGFDVKGTRCQYINTMDKLNTAIEEDKQITSTDYQGTWEIDAEGFKEVSKEFKVNFEIYGCDYLGGFSQDVEIKNGLIIKNTCEKIKRDWDEEETVYEEVEDSQEEDDDASKLMKELFGAKC